MDEPYTVDTKISEVIGDPVLGEYGRLIFPVDRGSCSSDTLGDLRLAWYSDTDPDKTVEIANYLRARAAAPGEIADRSVCIDGDIGEVLRKLKYIFSGICQSAACIGKRLCVGAEKT